MRENPHPHQKNHCPGNQMASPVAEPGDPGECTWRAYVRMRRRPQLGGRGRVHPRSPTVLPMGAKWILKRGGVGYPGAYQEQGRGAQLLAR